MNSLRINVRDIEAGMRLVLEPEGCPITVLTVSASGVHIIMPDGKSCFVVPASSLRRDASWRALRGAA